MPKQKPITVAYFSMEFAIDARIPNYAGGLGVLAADIMHSFADKKFPAVGVSLIYHQDDDPKKAFQAEKYMKLLKQTVEVEIEDRQVKVGVYQYDVKSENGHVVPLYFLTTNFPKNKGWDRDLTKWLYATDEYTRVGQEAILGIGGVRMLKKLGYTDIKTFHMNEGHSAFLTLQCLKDSDFRDEDAKRQCTFTTHTPIPAGHDYFDYRLVGRVLGSMVPWHVKRLATEERLSMTHLAMNLSRRSNSVSERHNQVCHEMFPEYQFANVTNGIHHLTWVADPMAKLFEGTLKNWRKNPTVLSSAAEKLDDGKLRIAHQESKKKLVQWINSKAEFFSYHSEMYTEDHFDEETLTIAFARRFVPYKRPALIFRDLDKLRDLGYRKLQFVFSGKCHPNDQFCNWKAGDLRKFAERLRGQIRVAVIPDYNIDIAKRLISGADIWLNNPIKPREASGTSGMKAALNGVLNLSVLDGWWIEGFQMNPKAGWGFGDKSDQLDEKVRDDMDSQELYMCLEDAVTCYYEQPEKWIERMKAAVSLAGFFNTHRVVDEYDEKMWS